MLIRDLRRFLVLFVPLFTAIFLTVRLIRKHTHPRPYGGGWSHSSSSHQSSSSEWAAKNDVPRERPPPPPPPPDQLSLAPPDPFDGGVEDVPPTHHGVSSAGLLPSSRRFFPVRFADVGTINPNILPHPTRADTYVVVAQEHPPRDLPRVAELVCNAQFRRGALSCVTFPAALAIAPTAGKAGACNIPDQPRLAPLGVNEGPHDARVFYGPTGNPFVVYGSNSGLTCFGQWVQDFRGPAGWVAADAAAAAAAADPLGISAADADAAWEPFANATELRRPEEASVYSPVEKNWFVFWDRRGAMYAHHDMHPRRVFGLLGADGRVGPDLGPASADRDAACMARYLPALQEAAPGAGAGAERESIHQATNSLSVTMCRRADASCEARPENTFVFVLVHHKSHSGYRGVYEPYAVVFRQRAPDFSLHAISARPLWIRGRRTSPLTQQSEMFYVTSMSWMGKGGRYHGYLDDVLLVGFGIQDQRSGGIDVLAEELLGGLGLCEGVAAAASA